jgi:hypothetical protein
MLLFPFLAADDESYNALIENKKACFAVQNDFRMIVPVPFKQARHGMTGRFFCSTSSETTRRSY